MIEYNTSGAPTKLGVYAVRVASDVLPLPFLRDEFMYWDGKRWGWCGSDQNYRGVVYGWVGPLRRLKADVTDSTS